jgi:hypothetical protein
MKAIILIKDRSMILPKNVIIFFAVSLGLTFVSALIVMPGCVTAQHEIQVSCLDGMNDGVPIRRCV